MKYTDLGGLLWRKEIKHWKRMFSIPRSISGWPGKLVSAPTLIILITIFHWGFALMHGLFETYLYLTNRSQFDKNLQDDKKKAGT